MYKSWKVPISTFHCFLRQTSIINGHNNKHSSYVLPATAAKMDYATTTTMAAQQQAVYHNILASFLSVESLSPGLQSSAKHNIHAEKVALVQTKPVVPCFFERPSENKWRRDSFWLPAVVAPLDWYGEVDEWLVTFAVTRLIDCTLTAGADNEDLPILIKAHWR